MTPDPRHDSSLGSLFMRRYRSMGITAALLLVGGFALLSRMPNQYEAGAKVLIVRNEQRMGGLKVVSDSLPELTGASHPLYTQIEIMRSQPILMGVIKRLDLKEPDGNRTSPDQLLDRLSISSIKGTDLIAISYRSPDPLKAQKIVSTLCDAYMSATERYRRDGVRDGLRYLDEQLQVASMRLQQSEARLEAFKSKSGMVSFGEEIQASVKELSELDQMAALRRHDLEAARARADNLRRQLGMRSQDGLVAATLTQDPRIRALQEQLLAAETAPLRSEAAPDHPQLIALDRQADRLRQQLAQELRQLGRPETRPLNDVQLEILQQLTAAENDVQAAAAGLKAADGSRRLVQTRMAGMPAREIQLTRLAREVDVSSRLYQEILEKREEARLNLAIAPTYARLIQPARIPTRPKSPLKGQGAPVMVLVALAGAFAVGMARELIDRRPEPLAIVPAMPDLSIFTTLPTLSMAERRQGELVARTGENPRYLEALRHLGLAIEDQLEGGSGRVLSVTSVGVGEGKSVTVANLALCLAHAGHRVLLVDGDHRWPRVHELFGAPNAADGLSDILVEGQDPSSVVQRVGELDIVKAGSARLTSNTLRLQNALKPTLDQWRQGYDFILIDLPPLLMFSEVAHFGRLSDGVLMVANLPRLAPEALGTGVSQLQAARVPVLGVVALGMAGLPGAAPGTLQALGGRA